MYFYLHMDCCMISENDLLAQGKEVEECWMYTPDLYSAVDARHHMVGYMWKWAWMCNRWTTEHTL